MSLPIKAFSLLTLSCAMVLSGCAATPTSPSPMHGHQVPVSAAVVEGGAEVDPPVVDLKAMPDLQAILPRLAEHRVVFVGETHDRYDHHLSQLAIIRGLYAGDPRLAIGLEAFQQPFQSYLDDYVAGTLDIQGLLRKTEYYERWRFDFRLYQPILAFARERRIPLIALNLPQEITRKVGREGLGALTPEERVQVPAELDRSDGDYRDRLRGVFEQHRGRGSGDFDRFLDVQLLWDEGMAERAARFMQRHPSHRLVVLAGSGHLQYGSGIPNRVSRRTGARGAIVLNGGAQGIDAAMGDYLVLPEPRSLPPAGRLGVILDTSGAGVSVASFAAHSAGKAAGMREGDRIVALSEQPIRGYSDVKIALWDKQPGERVQVRVRRDGWLFQGRELDLDVTLN